jgi:hypothetical protein
MRQNSRTETNEDYLFTRCRWCNFPLDKSRDRASARVGIVYSTLSPAPTASDAPKDFVINSGCPFCGTPQPY